MDGVPRPRLPAEAGSADSFDAALTEPVTATERNATVAGHGLALQLALAEIAADLGIIDTVSEATRAAPSPSDN